MLNKDGQRELAYVVTIDNIQPIVGKDRVECAIVDIIADGNTAEIKKNKDGILILEVFRKKIKKD